MRKTLTRFATFTLFLLSLVTSLGDSSRVITSAQ